MQPQNIAQLKVMLQTILENLLNKTIRYLSDTFF